MKDMLTAVLKAKSPGDEDTVFNTTLIRVVLHKALANTLNDSTIGSDLGLFTLPKLGLFQNGVFMDDSLGLQVTKICSLTKKTKLPIYNSFYLYKMCLSKFLQPKRVDLL